VTRLGYQLIRQRRAIVPGGRRLQKHAYGIERLGGVAKLGRVGLGRGKGGGPHRSCIGDFGLDLSPWYASDNFRTIRIEAYMPASADEAAELVPGPDSAVWRYAGDARLLAGAGYALLLQVSHPTVGAGVSEHSNFKADPWGRLFRTLDYSYSLVYGGPELAREVGARVFRMHKQIKGTRPDGRRYHALEPEAYAWVHATLAESIVSGNQRFALHMPADEIERFWFEWRALGRLVGVQTRELPEDWAGFRAYFERMVEERLEDNEAVQDVFDIVARPARPPLPLLPEVSWRIARLPMARLLSLGTVGLLPGRLRERFGVGWSRAQELELSTVGALARSATPLLSRSLRDAGAAYLRWRREALARGERAALRSAA
jgi:uncharacterized protein (DUF2236 family)